MGLPVGVRRLAGVAAGVLVRRGVGDAQLGGDAVQLADLGRAGLAGESEVVSAVLAPFDAAKEKRMSDPYRVRQAQ